MNLPSDVLYILNKFKDENFYAYPVGGCVRDSLLGTTPGDWDITTDATPVEILEVFNGHKVITLGEKFGTIGVLINGKIYEITTMRYDHSYNDNRHPSQVSFTKNLIEDLKRRDFTINSMAYDHINKKVIDPFDGQEDLKRRVIKAVGNPDERFKEDALRIMRAIRFSAKLDFEIETNTLYSICTNVNLLKNIAMERIKIELDKTLICGDFETLRNLYNCNIFYVLFPEIHKMFETTQNNNYHIYNVGDHSLMAVTHIKDDIILKYVALLHDVGKVPAKTVDNGKDHFYYHSQFSVEIARDILNRLRFSNEDKHRVLKIIEFHDTVLNTRLKSIMKFVVDRNFSYEDFLDLLEMTKADTLAQNPLYINRLFKLDEIKEAYENVYKGPHKICDLAVDGRDMIELGYENANIKKILVYLLKQVIADPGINRKDKLMDIATKVKDEICKD